MTMISLRRNVVIYSLACDRLKNDHGNAILNEIRTPVRTAVRTFLSMDSINEAVKYNVFSYSAIILKQYDRFEIELSL